METSFVLNESLHGLNNVNMGSIGLNTYCCPECSTDATFDPSEATKQDFSRQKATKQLAATTRSRVVAPLNIPWILTSCESKHQQTGRHESQL
jgi:hypothetical protein